MKKDQKITLEAIEDFLKRKLSASLSIAPDVIDIHQPLTNYGLDSMSSVVLVGELEEWLNVELSATLLWDYPTISDLSEYLSKSASEAVYN